MEVKINGILAELGDSIPAITKKSFDINNPSIRFIDFTNKFKLPDTILNRQIFNSPQNVGSNNRSFEKVYSVVINDVYQIFRGKGFLDSSSNNEFSFQVVDDSRDLFNKLEVKLNSIIWDDLDTVLTEAAINAQDTIDINNCWFWGKACYHQQSFTINTDQTTGDDRCKYSRPAFYLQALLNRAVINSGYTLVSTLPDLAISSNHKDFFFTSYQKTINATYDSAGTLALTGLNSYDFKVSSVTATNTTIHDVHKFNFRVRGTFTTTADIKLLIHAVDNTGTKIIDNNISLPTNGVVDFTTTEIYEGPTGMTVTFTLVGTGSVIFSDVLIYTILSENNEDLSTNPFLNYKIKVYDNLPDISYLDIFKTICTISNKYQVIDNYKKIMSFGSFASMNKLNTLDWSDKFIIGSENITSDFAELGQKNYIKYTNDKTVSVELGQSYFEIDNENLADEIYYIIMNFGASKEVVVNNNTIAHVQIYNDTTRIPDQEINMRLFYCNVDKLQFDQISWVNNAYYTELFNSLFRTRSISCELNISKLDFLKWNPNMLIYIDYFKTTFFVIEISNFIPGRATKVKLLGYGR
jgi:hypothetical protein